jgi:dsRNA-specific ribonuclease
VEAKLFGGRKFLGIGSSIKEAEFNAAKKAIEALQHEIRTFDSTKRTTAPLAMKSKDFTPPEIARLQRFWRDKIQPTSNRIFDWRLATVVNASTMKLRGFIEQRMRDRYSCFGSRVLAYFATEELADQWSKEGRASTDEGEFRSRFCGKKQLEHSFTRLGFENYALLASGESEISPSCKHDTMQVMFAILFLEFGEHKARAFFRTHAEITIELFSERPLQFQNYKGKLQEQVQEMRRAANAIIEYKVLKEIAGPNPESEVQLWISGQKFEKGFGRGKRDAEQQAAQRTLDSKAFSEFLAAHAATES